MTTQVKLKEQMRLLYDTLFYNIPNKNIFKFLKSNEDVSYDMSSNLYKKISQESFEHFMKLLFLADIEKYKHAYDNTSEANKKQITENFQNYKYIFIVLYMVSLSLPIILINLNETILNDIKIEDINGVESYIVYNVNRVDKEFIPVITSEYCVTYFNKNTKKIVIYIAKQFKPGEPKLAVIEKVTPLFNKELEDICTPYIMSIFDDARNDGNILLLILILGSYIEFYKFKDDILYKSEESIFSTVDLKNGNLELIITILNSSIGDSPEIIVKAKCIETCPIQFVLYNNEYDNESNDKCFDIDIGNGKTQKVSYYKPPNNVDLINNYLITQIMKNNENIIQDSIKYDILDFDKNKSILRINAISFNDKSCRSYSNKMSSLIIEKDDIFSITFSKKQLVLNEYQKIGKRLKELNQDLDSYKSKLNKTIKSKDIQEHIIKYLNIRTYIYYVIFGVIMASYLIMFLIETNKDRKVYICLGMFIILFSINIVNYFLNYNYIENFSLSGDKSNIDKLLLSFTNDMTIEEKLEDIIKLKDLYDKIITECIKTYILSNKMYDISHTTDIIVKSLRDEVRIFEEKKDTYQYKLQLRKDAVDLMKHETISKTGFVNFISIAFLIFSIILLIFVYFEDYNIDKRIYIALFIVFQSINLYKYYYTILHPVRVRARNKYWYKISSNTQSQVN